MRYTTLNTKPFSHTDQISQQAEAAIATSNMRMTMEASQLQKKKLSILQNMTNLQGSSTMSDEHTEKEKDRLQEELEEVEKALAANSAHLSR